MTPRAIAAAILLLASIPMISLAEQSFDAAKAFGARPSVEDLSLSPDGMSVAFVAPTKGQGSMVFVQSLAKGAPRASKPILGASGKPRAAWRLRLGLESAFGVFHLRRGCQQRRA